MKNLENTFKNRIKKAVKMADYTSFRIGGPAQFFLEINSREELISAIENSIKDNTDYFILGGGSNLLVSDSGINKLVIKINYKKIEKQDENLLVGAGTSIKELVNYCIKNSLGEFEFLAGIPGSVGGAICGNAGAYGNCISDFLLEVNVINSKGELRTIKTEDLEFDYRESRLKYSDEVVIDALFKFGHGNSDETKVKVKEYIQLRRMKHPPRELGCAGSYFKNLPPFKPGDRRIAAGLYLDQVGAKGMNCGEAEVFIKHANMIVNKGNALATDVLKLADKMKKIILEKYDIILIEEVRFIGEPVDLENPGE